MFNSQVNSLIAIKNTHCVTVFYNHYDNFICDSTWEKDMEMERFHV